MGIFDSLFNKIDERREIKRIARQEELEHKQKVQAAMHEEQLKFEQEQWEKECQREEARREAEKQEVARLLNLSEKEIWAEILVKLRNIEKCQTDMAKGIEDLNLRVSYLEEQAENTDKSLESITCACNSIQSNLDDLSYKCNNIESALDNYN